MLLIVTLVTGKIEFKLAVPLIINIQDKILRPFKVFDASYRYKNFIETRWHPYYANIGESFEQYVYNIPTMRIYSVFIDHKPGCL